MKHTTYSNTETRSLGAAFAKKLSGGVVVCLHGDLGAGKTTFVKGIAEALGVTDEIKSPTFTLMNTYKIASSAKTLVHIDTYRLKDQHELIAIGAEDYVGEKNTIAIIEWPEKIAALLQGKKILNVFLTHEKENERTVTFE